MKIIESQNPIPRVAMIYGEPGIGKTTLAARLHEKQPTLLLDLEGRSAHVRVPRVVIDDWNALRGALAECRSVPHRIIAIDTLDRAQDYCAAALLQARGWDTIEAPGYGRGYAELRHSMLALAEDVEALRQAGKGVLLLAHAARQRVEDPVHGEWDRWSVRLHDAARSSVAAVYIERADIIGLAAMAVVRADEKARYGSRILYLTPHAGRLTKSVVEPVDMKLDDAPAWLAEALVPAVQDEGVEIGRRMMERLGGRQQLAAYLRERGLSARAMTVDDWRRVEEEFEEVPE